METSRIEAAAPSNRRRSAFAAAFTAGRRELLIAGLCLIGLQFLIGFTYVRRGGFVLDDWLLAAGAKLHGGFGAVVSANIAVDPRRPLGAIYLATTNTVLGTHQHAQLAWVAVTHVAFALALFAVLWKLGIDLASAVCAAALCLLFPFSDSLWLWATLGQLNLAATLWLRRGRRKARQSATGSQISSATSRTRSGSGCAGSAGARTSPTHTQTASLSHW